MTAVQASSREDGLAEDIRSALESKNYSVGVPVTHTHTLRELLLRSSVDMETSNSTSITALCTLDAEPSETIQCFEKLLRFTQEKGHTSKAEIAQVLFPIFVHFYLDLLSASHSEAALSLFSRFKDSIGGGHSSELKELSELTSPDQLPSSSIATKFRKQKYCLRMSNVAFQLLIQFLQVCSTPVLFNVIHRYLSIEVYGNTPMVNGDHKSDQKKSTSSPSFTKPTIPQLAPENVTHAKTRHSSTSKFTLAHGTDPTSRPLPLQRTQSVGAPPPPTTAASLLNEFRERLQTTVRASQLEPTPPSISLHTVTSTHPQVHCAAYNSNKALFCYGFSNSSICLWPELPPATDHMISHDHVYPDTTVSQQATNNDQREPTASPITLVGHHGPVYGTCFNTKGQYLLSSSEDCTIRLWDVDERSCVVCYRGHQYPVWNVAFSPVDVYFASCSHDTTARLWVTDLAYPLRIFAGHTSGVNVAQFHPNGKYVATGSSDHTCRLWDINSGQCVRLFTGKKGPIHSIVFSPNGKQLIASGQDGIVCQWDLGSGSIVGEFLGHTAPISALTCSSDGTMLASSGYDHSLRLWNMNAANTTKSDPISIHSTPNALVLCLKFTHRNHLKALACHVQPQKMQPQQKIPL